MKSNNIEKRIDFEAPNNIDLDMELWEDKPVRFLVHEIPLYAALLSVLPILAFLITSPMSLSGGLVAVGVSAGMNVVARYLQKRLIRQHRESQFSYRKKYVPLLTELLKENGLTIAEDDQRALALILKSDFKVLNTDGVKYKSAGIVTYDDKIAAVFFLSDVEAQRTLIKQENENRIERTVNSYEAKHGQFATPDLREAFIDGLRHTLR